MPADIVGHIEHSYQSVSKNRVPLKTQFRAGAHRFCSKFCVKTAGILDVFQGFYKKKLGEKVASLAEREFLEVPNLLALIIYGILYHIQRFPSRKNEVL